MVVLSWVLFSGLKDVTGIFRGVVWFSNIFTRFWAQGTKISLSFRAL